jgi:murein DD-endopeptidase MepM/ murein hydrolase activator NlpD
MPTTCPEPAVRPWRGGVPFVLALLLTVGAFAPVAAPAAVEGRPAPPPDHPRVPSPAGAPDRRVPPLWMPVAGAVVRGSDARDGPYGPGHRGIDVAASVGEVVRAPAAGEVVFAGPVAGTRWFSVRVAPEVVVTVGPLRGGVVTAGWVRRGTPVGWVAAGHGPDPAGGAATLHLSLRVDGAYLDPLAYLVDRPRPRLAPLPSPGGLPGA